MTGSLNSTNSSSFIHSQQYSNFILRNLDDGMMPENMYRNVTDFMTGTTLNIKTIGDVTIQEVSSETPLIYNPIDSGNVTLQVTDYVGNAWAVDDVLKMDGTDIDALMSAQALKQTHAIQQHYETRFFETANDAQTAGDPNNINGFDHRLVASGTNLTLAENDLIDMGLAFDKADVPSGGRVAFVDPVTAAVLQKKVTIVTSLDRDPRFMEVMSNRFVQDHKFVMVLHGWEIYTSNRLPTISSGTSIDGTTNAPAEGATANIFMSVADDNTRPMMSAWRLMPTVEGERNKDLRRDEFVQTARFALGAQRVDTLGVIATSATKTA